MVQRISTKLDHLREFTWTPKANFFNHSVISYDRFDIPATGDFQGLGWASKIGLTGLPNGDAGGFPGLNFDQRYSALGKPAAVTVSSTDRYQFLNDSTYLVGKHTLKFGFEFRRERYAIGSQGNTAGVWNFSFRNTGAFSASGAPINNTGDPYASMLLAGEQCVVRYIGEP